MADTGIFATTAEVSRKAEQMQVPLLMLKHISTIL